MALLEKWQKMAYNENMDQGELQRFWQRYFLLEQGVYEQLLTNPDEAVEGTVKELAEKYNTELLITANDRTGLLIDITLALNELKIPIRALNAKVSKNLLSFINITLEIDSAEKLTRAITRIKKVKEVISVTRSSK